MINPWIQNYLTLSLAGIRVAEQACLFWQDMLYACIGGTHSASAEPWLAVVAVYGAESSRYPGVGNCAAAAYSRWGMDLSRLQVANGPAYCRHNRCS